MNLEKTRTKSLRDRLARRIRALRHSERLWRQALEDASDGVWDLDLETHHARYSPRYERALGYAVGEMTGTHAERRDNIHPDDKARAVAAGQVFIDGRTDSYAVEYRLRCKAGDYKWMFARAAVVGRDADGQALRVIGTHTDLTARKAAESAIVASEQRFRDIVNTTDGIVWEADARTFQFTFISDKAERLLGYPTQDWLEPGFWAAHLHPEDRAWAPDYRASCTGRIEPHDFEYRFIARDGSTLWLHDIVTVTAEDGAPRWLRGIMVDITQRKRAEDKLRLAASVFTHVREGILITDAHGDIIDVNDAFTRITGYARGDVLGRNPRLLSSGRHEPAFYAALWRTIGETGHWSGEVWNRRKCGQVYPEQLTITAVRDGNGRTQQYVALFSDITTVKERQTWLEHIAHYDALTTLPNRVLLADRLQQAMASAQRRGQRLAVVYLDLDRFKQVNDDHGHAVGDQLLVGVSARLKHALREGDTLARLGGDEFVAVLLDLADTDASAPMLTRMLDAIAQPVQVDGLSIQVSGSLGVTFFPQADDIDADQLLRQADQAMYQAKQAGRNGYQVFDAEQDRVVRGHHESLDRIRSALAEGEFLLHYQPKVNMRSGAVIGAEALIRWQHPERGLLAPAAFLPVIENHALAVDVGEWVIATALAQMAQWQAEGARIPLSVNLGARQLQQAGFAERLRALLSARPEVAPGDLELEVLETSALKDLAHVCAVLKDCRALGVSFALDDFGVGYSSLTYLKHLPVSRLKIDQSFVRDMLDDPDDLAILDGVIGLSAAFQREVIAEGVETIEQGAMLLRLGCEQAQGYGIARPMPAAQLRAWAAAWRVDPSWTEAPAMERDELPLLFAAVEHRAWVAALERHLQGTGAAPPLLTAGDCRFGKWLKAGGLKRHGAGAPALCSLHEQMHALAAQLCTLHAQGAATPMTGPGHELRALCDAWRDQLQQLLRAQTRVAA